MCTPRSIIHLNVVVAKISLRFVVDNYVFSSSLDKADLRNFHVTEANQFKQQQVAMP
jgi:hypothetical protein